MFYAIKEASKNTISLKGVGGSQFIRAFKKLYSTEKTEGFLYEYLLPVFKWADEFARIPESDNAEYCERVVAELYVGLRKVL